jgi:hypothetical protein
MKKCADKPIAIAALIFFAVWLFVGLPMMYAPGEGHVHGAILGVKYGECLLFLATVVLAWTTWMLVKGAEKTAERQLRAYVLVDKATAFSANREGAIAFYGSDTGRGGQPLEIRSGYQPVAIFEFKNFGQTPAHDVEMFGNAAIVPWPLKLETLPEIDFSQNHSKQIIGPGGIRTKYDLFVEPHIITGEEYQGLTNERLAIFFFGEVRYLDAFGKRRVTRYRFFSGGQMGLRGTTLGEHDGGNSYA